MENKEKLISLFKCIRELCGLKYKLITNIDKQVWYKFIDDIPMDTENIKIHDINMEDNEFSNQADDKTILLEVSKPEFYSCPPLPELLNGWVKSDWRKYSIEIEIIETDEKTEEKFIDSKERTDAFNTWKTKRDEWVKEQIRIERTRSFFAELYYNYTTLDRESESIEMMVGEGLIEENPRSDIYHPVLLKKVKMEFDSEKNVISIVDTDADIELYTVLMQDINYINHDAITKIKEQIINDELHPLDRITTPIFLKSFLHRLCSASNFKQDYNTEVSNDDKLIMSLRPAFFIKKRDGGVFNAIDDIIIDINDNGIKNGPLIDIIGGKKVNDKSDDNKDTLSSINGEDDEVLLCKDANEEQLEIAKRIENYNAVLVQGPPGTGKTHTIANLIGHFLSQGKSILVTSHTKKALNVLIDKVPKQLQSLCVSLLEDNNKDMERSIDGITEIISAHSTFELKETVDKLKIERGKILKELTEIRKKIKSIMYKEYQSIIYDGKGYSVKEASIFVNQNSDALSIIPGNVKLYRTLPVSLGDLDILYNTNELLNPNEEIELKYDLPNPELLITPYSFKRNIDNLNELKNRAKEIEQVIGEEFKIDLDNKKIEVNKKPIVNNLNVYELLNLKALIDNIEGIDEWMAFTILDGIRGGGYKDVWNKLINDIEETVEYASSTIGTVLGNKIVIDEELGFEMLNTGLNELLMHFNKGKKVSKLDRVFHKTWGEIIDKTRINDSQLNSAADCTVVLSYLNLSARRKSLGIIWDELVYKNGGPMFAEFGAEPERTCYKRLDKIKNHLNWNDKIVDPLKRSIISSGLDIDVILPKKEFNTDMEELQDKISIIIQYLPLYIEAIEIIYIKINEIEKEINETINILSNGNSKKSDVCSNLLKSILNKDILEYEENYDNYKILFNKFHYLNERSRILNLIKTDAPDWAANIENRIGIHSSAFVPNNIEDAWTCKQLAGIINEIIEEPFESLINKSVQLSLELKMSTEKLAVAKGWFYLLQRIENDLAKQRALNGWKLTTRKIGKNTKNGPRLKQQARELMVECQSAVPVWVMTINKALECMKPSMNKFDIVIIDEASQSDVSALPILYLAKKIIIVGDDEQVSPSAVGVEQDKINAVQDMFIKNLIANYHLYDLKTSIYDLASTTFSNIMLKEHFRSVPDIIGYSNKLSYNYKIKPLRDDSSSILKPATISFRVNGVRENRRKINKAEADNIVALMMACIEQPEYEGKTFGAISLLGDTQAKLINETAIQRMNLKDYEQRKIMCGNASQFQGDERDVIFISLVDNNEGEGPLRLTGEGSEKSTKQRYNVAVSRAKDQVWVVHSLDIYNDLKNGDMRRDLLEYINSPRSFRQLIEISDKNSESEFEKQVCRKLISRGYHIKQQWEVGAYRIDIVAIFGDKKIAIECDGDRYHGEDKIIDDIRRQNILERLGWRFIRIRGSEYFRYPEETMDRVFADLEKYEIFPETVFTETATTDVSNNYLFNRIKIRAFQILQEWEEDSNNGYNSSYSLNISQDYSMGMEKPINNYSNKKIEVEKEIKTHSGKHNVTQQSEQIVIPNTVDKATEDDNSFKTSSKKHIQTKDNMEIKQNKVSMKGDSISNTKDDIVKKLLDAGYDVIDNRTTSEIIWVIYNTTSNEILDNIIGSKYKAILELRGSKATQNKPAWRVTKNK